MGYGMGWPWLALPDPCSVALSLSFLDRMSLESRDGTAQGKDWEITHQLPSWAKRLTSGKLILLPIEITEKWAPSGLQLSSGHLQLLWQGVFHGLQGWYLLQHGAFQRLQALLLEALPPLVTVHGVCRVVPHLWLSHTAVQWFDLSCVHFSRDTTLLAKGLSPLLWSCGIIHVFGTFCPHRSHPAGTSLLVLGHVDQIKLSMKNQNLMFKIVWIILGTLYVYSPTGWVTQN